MEDSPAQHGSVYRATRNLSFGNDSLNYLERTIHLHR